MIHHFGGTQIRIKKLYTLSLLVLTGIIPVVTADVKWYPPEMEPPDEFDIVGTLDVGTLQANYSVYPGITTLHLVWNITDEETWYTYWYVLNLIPQATGYYNITVWFDVINPFRKWAYGLYIADVDPTPFTMVETYEFSWAFPGSYLQPFACACPPRTYYAFIMAFNIIAHVIAAGEFEVHQFGNQLRTDINKDCKVRVDDILAVALAVGETYVEDPIPEEEVLIDMRINYYDVKAVAVEFGRWIPDCP